MKTTSKFNSLEIQSGRYRQRRLVLSCLAIGVGVLMLTGCAQYAAMNQPKPFKPTATVVGAERGAVTAELGSPIVSTERGDSLKETYKYADGGSKNKPASKTARVVVYSAGDVFTLFLDQLVTWPVETYAFAGTSHVVTVNYVKGSGGFWCAETISDVEAGKTNPNDSSLQDKSALKGASTVGTIE